MEAHQREALYVTKLSALVGAPAEPVRGGAGAVIDGTAWFLGEDLGVRALGPAFSWADQRGALRLSVIVPSDAAGVVARRAVLFRDPPSVWCADGRDLVAAVPTGLSPPPPIPQAVEDLVDLILDAGAEPVVEHGVLTGEVAGLEVRARSSIPTRASSGSRSASATTIARRSHWSTATCRPRSRSRRWSTRSARIARWARLRTR